MPISIDTLSFPELLVLIGIAGVPVLIFIFKGFEWKGQKNSFSFKGLFKKKVKEDPKATCLRATDIVMVMTKTTETMHHVDEIHFRDKLADQMHFAEERMFIVRSQLLSVYTELLSDKLGEGEAPYSHPHYHKYALLIELLETEVLTLIRFACRKNGFDKMSKMEFDNYVNDKITSITTFMENFILERYINLDWLVPLVELRKHNAKYSKSWKDEFCLIFSTALKIALEKEEDIQELNKDLSDFLVSIGIPATNTR